MAVAVLAALIHRNRTGEGQWIDMGCTDAGVVLRPRAARLHGERTAAPAAGLPYSTERLTRDGAAQHLQGARRRPVVRGRVP